LTIGVVRLQSVISVTFLLLFHNLLRVLGKEFFFVMLLSHEVKPKVINVNWLRIVSEVHMVTLLPVEVAELREAPWVRKIGNNHQVEEIWL